MLDSYERTGLVLRVGRFYLTGPSQWRVRKLKPEEVLSCPGSQGWEAADLGFKAGLFFPEPVPSITRPCFSSSRCWISWLSFAEQQTTTNVAAWSHACLLSQFLGQESFSVLAFCNPNISWGLIWSEASAGESFLHASLGCWQNSSSCKHRIEMLVFLVAVSQGPLLVFRNCHHSRQVTYHQGEFSLLLKCSV